jgi:mannose-6-phosphate isomerase-like protein (cupin superfamily)
MKASITQQDTATEFWTDERCHIIEVSNSENDPDVSIARARVEPGVTTAWHSLKEITERYYILEGEGLVEVGDLAPQTVTQGASVLIPPDVRQRISNSGTTDLVFLAICSPRFVVDAYVDLESV